MLQTTKNLAITAGKNAGRNPSVTSVCPAPHEIHAVDAAG